MTKATQLRGNCQCCGRLQAVTKGLVAKHGYRVENRGQAGWFSGTCPGHQYAPMQVSRETTDSVIAKVRAECAELRARADAFEAGSERPATVRTQRFDPATREYVRVAWEKAQPFQQKDEVRTQVVRFRQRAAQGESWAGGMEKLANEVHGQPLVAVQKA